MTNWIWKDQSWQQELRYIIITTQYEEFLYLRINQTNEGYHWVVEAIGIGYDIETIRQGDTGALTDAMSIAWNQAVEVAIEWGGEVN